MSKQEIYICSGRWCHELGAKRLFKQVKKYFRREKDVTVEQCRCLGYCEQGINAMKNGRIYHELTEDTVIDRLQGSGTTRGGAQIHIGDDFLGDI